MFSELIIHNIGYMVSILVNIGLGFVAFYHGQRKTTNIFYFLTTLTVVVFGVAHVLGTNVSDPALSRFFFIFTLINIVTVGFNAHFALAAIGKDRQYMKSLGVIYALGLALIMFFLSNIDNFLQISKKTLYFPNYYVPGKYYWLFIAYFFGVVTFYVAVMIHTYHKRTDSIERNQIKFYLWSFFFGYLFGSIGFLTAYFPFIDPILSMLFGLYTLPLAYGILKYDILNVHVIAKKAAVYAIFTGFFSVVISAISFSNTYISQSIPNFPSWLIPFGASVLSVTIGAFVWNKLKDVDVLKYEFINNVTHKFRTPLTHIRWLAEELRDESDPMARRGSIDQIQAASMRLFELTNIVIDVAHDNNADYLYQFKRVQLDRLINEIIASHEDALHNRNLEVKFNILTVIPETSVDERRLSFAIQILFENSLVYTPKGGKIIVSLSKEGQNLLFQISDDGIGIPPVELPYLFSKFYRAQNARRTDTEGMGIGLFMAKEIIVKHNGAIWAESSGVGKGSTFSFTLPIN